MVKMSLIILPNIASPNIPLVLALAKTFFKLPISFASPFISPIPLFTSPICCITEEKESFNLPSKVF